MSIILPAEIYYHIFMFMDGLERQNIKLVCKEFSLFRFAPKISNPELAREVELFILPESIIKICEHDYGHHDIVIRYINKHKDNISEYLFDVLFRYGIEHDLDNMLGILMSIDVNPAKHPSVADYYKLAYVCDGLTLLALIAALPVALTNSQLEMVNTIFERTNHLLRPYLSSDDSDTD